MSFFPQNFDQLIGMIELTRLIKFISFAEFFINQSTTIFALCPMHYALTSPQHAPRNPLFHIAKRIFADQIHDVRGRIGIGDSVPIC
jgi:hypothetical protein